MYQVFQDLNSGGLSWLVVIISLINFYIGLIQVSRKEAKSKDAK